MKSQKEVDEKFRQNGYLHKVKIFYSNGNYKYANLFKVKDYDNGVMLGTIKKYRHMNRIERFLYRHCL